MLQTDWQTTDPAPLSPAFPHSQLPQITPWTPQELPPNPNIISFLVKGKHRQMANPRHLRALSTSICLKTQAWMQSCKMEIVFLGQAVGRTKSYSFSNFQTSRIFLSSIFIFILKCSQRHSGSSWLSYRAMRTSVRSHHTVQIINILHVKPAWWGARAPIRTARAPPM